MNASEVLERAAQLLERPDIRLNRFDYFSPDQSAFCTMGAVRQVISPGNAVPLSERHEDWYYLLEEVRTAICLEVGYSDKYARGTTDYPIAMWNDYGRLAYTDAPVEPPEPPTKEEVVAVLRRAKERLA